MNNFPKFYNKIFDYSLKKGTHIRFKDILKTESINNKELHNVKYYNYYVFINNLMKEDQTSHFNKYKQMNDNLHEHLWDKIYDSYKINMSHIQLKSFLAKYIV